MDILPFAQAIISFWTLVCLSRSVIPEVLEFTHKVTQQQSLKVCAEVMQGFETFGCWAGQGSICEAAPAF